MLIHECAARGDVEGVRAELANGVSLEARDRRDPATPLMRAVSSNGVPARFVQWLIDRGADVNAAADAFGGPINVLSLAVGAGGMTRQWRGGEGV